MNEQRPLPPPESQSRYLKTLPAVQRPEDENDSVIA